MFLSPAGGELTDRVVLPPRLPNPCRVSAHYVDHKDRARPITTILIKFDSSVMQRQAYIDALKRA